MSAAQQFDNVSVISKANVYFDGKVVSHTLLLADGSKKTIGLIYPGTFKFNTGAPEKMEIISGSCTVRQANESGWKIYQKDTYFKVPGNSFFEISVESGIAEYICSFE
jgi:uncharacterized protein YaiE (UPF0345 family)